MGVIFEEVTAEVAPPAEDSEPLQDETPAFRSIDEDTRRWRRELALWQRRSRRLEAD